MESNLNVDGRDVDLKLLKALHEREFDLHTHAGFRRIVASIKAIGLIEPLSVYQEDGHYPIAEDAPEHDEDGRDVEDLTPAERAEIASASRQQIEASVALYHPKTIAEAVETVVNALSAEKKAMIRQQAKDDFVSSSHFGMGMAIRNSMIYQNANQIDLMADFQRGCRQGLWQGEPDVDAVSRVIVEQVWEQLQGDKG